MEKKLGLGILGAARMLDQRGGLGGVDRLEPVIQNHYRPSGSIWYARQFISIPEVSSCGHM